MKKINTALEAKKRYLSPSTSAQLITHSGVLCASGDRVVSNVTIHGGDQSGSVTDAF